MIKRYLTTIPREKALSEMLNRVAPITEEEYLPVYQCKGRILTKPVFARYSNPPFICAAMDGYATLSEKTSAADISNPLSMKKDIDVFSVNTGDPLPDNTDSVIPLEEVEDFDTSVIIRKPVYLWQNVRMVGEDIIEGDMLLPTNHSIRSFDIGMLLSAGITHTYVRRKPKLLIIPTGKELIDLYEKPEALKEQKGLIDFNSYTLLRLGEDRGFDVKKSKIVSDKDELTNIIKASIDSFDVIIINAGASAGKEDYTEAVIRELGILIFHGLSMMPGKPVMGGFIKEKPVFGIPGYPVSAIVCFQSFIDPLFDRLSLTTTLRKQIICTIPFKVPSKIGIEEIVRINLIEKGGIFYAFPLQRGASIFSSMARADATISIPENIEGYDENSQVPCVLLRDEGELQKRIHVIGSHDLSLDIIRDMLKIRHPSMEFLSTHTGSLSGLFAIKKGISDLCTTHILDEREGVYNIPAIKKYLEHIPCILINIAKRMQGLIVKKGNPKGIKGITDLGRDDIRFINRQPGSGTRFLLDAQLKEAGIDKHNIRGYDREESSHTAVAVMVKESVADTGIAIYGVTKIFSLDFIPLVEEDFDLLVTKTFTEDERFTMLIDLIQSKEFKGRLDSLGGYNTKETGTIKYVNG